MILSSVILRLTLIGVCFNIYNLIMEYGEVFLVISLLEMQFLPFRHMTVHMTLDI